MDNLCGVLPEMDQPRNHKFPNFVLRLPDGSPRWGNTICRSIFFNAVPFSYEGGLKFSKIAIFWGDIESSKIKFSHYLKSDRANFWVVNIVWMIFSENIVIKSQAPLFCKI